MLIRKIKIVRFMLIIVLAISIFLTIPSCEKKGKETVSIACNLPFTGSFSMWGERVQRGVQLALEDLKKTDKEIGSKLKFRWGDNAGSSSKAVSLMQKQLLEPTDIYMSGIAQQTLAIQDKINELGLPHIGWIFDAYFTRNHENAFRTVISYKSEPEMLLKYVKFRKPSKISIAYVNTSAAETEIKEILIPMLLDYGIEKRNILVEAYPWDKKDFKDIVNKFKVFNSDLFILNGFPSNVAGLVKALRAYNMVKEGNIIGTYDMMDAVEFLDNKELEGIRAVTPIFVSRGYKGDIEKWKNKYKSKYGAEARYIDAYAYDMTMIIYDVAKRVERPTNNENWIEAFRNTELDGITGPLEFDEDGDLKVSLDISVFRNGNFVKEKGIE